MGGSITISGQSFESVEQPATLEIIVSDNGIGIDPEHHEKIFETFYQPGEAAFPSPGPPNLQGGGPGLGFALVRGAVEAHGGRVWVESPGHNEQNYPGSHFYVHQPLKQPVS
jgi:signal transduction histidine kinase